INADDQRVCIGGPIDNTRFAVVSAQGQLSPIGVPGELWISGEGVSQGYHQRDELTASQFITPGGEFGEGCRWYRTGDRVRWLGDGSLEYLSRLDHQIKLRGFRIELGEIEQALQQLASVKDAVVTLYRRDEETAELAGYIVTTDESLSVTEDVAVRGEYVSALQRSLREVLPEYMVPETFVLLAKLPLTANGKVDRKALPAPETRTSEQRYVAPRTETEVALCGIWEEVLGVEQVGVEDNFFQLGGHSLLAVRLSAAIEQGFEQALPLKVILRSPTVAELAVYLNSDASVEDKQRFRFEQVTPAPESLDSPFPLTDVQQAYWLGREGDFELGNISTHGYVELPFTDVSPTRIEQTLNQLIQRHGMLRMIVNDDGNQQILAKVPDYALKVNDYRSLSTDERVSGVAALRQELSHQVLSTDTWPLFDFRFTRLSDNQGILHVSMDIMLVDASSMLILAREFHGLLSEPELPLTPLSLTFRDYVLAEERLKESSLYEASAQYWQSRIEDFPNPPALPLARDPSQIETPHFERRSHWLPQAQWQQVKQIAQQHQITPTVLFLTAVGEVLNRWSEQSHFVLNLTLFNRIPFHQEVNDILGDFTSLTLLEMDYRDHCQSFIARLKSVQSQLWEDLEYRYFSGVAMQRNLTSSRGHIVNFPVVVTSTLGLETPSDDNSAAPKPQDRDELMEGFSISQTSQVWLDMQLSDVNGGLLCVWDSVEGLFPQGMLDAMFAALWELFGALAESEQQWQQACPVAAPASVTGLVSRANDTAQPYTPGLIHAPVWEQVLNQGDKIAVYSEELSLSYRELGLRAQSLADELMVSGVGANELVAVVMDKSWAQVVAVLGILRAGAAYLPIDASLPTGRIHTLLASGEVQQVVTQAAHLEGLPDTVQAHVLSTGDTPTEGVSLNASDPSRPDALAYVIFTSGSTGTPKGVSMTHEAVLNTLEGINTQYQVTAADTVFGLSNLNFDLSVYDIFGVLGAGGSIVLPKSDEYRDPGAWLNYLTAESAYPDVTVWNTVPALMQLLVEQCEYQSVQLPLQTVMMSGDWLPTDLPARIHHIAPQAKQYSLGGATEAAIWSIHYPITGYDCEGPSIPYGKALPNQQMYVLSADMALSPVWVTGDIYIGGLGLAQGYWRDDAKTQASFVRHPQTGERLYRTGDRGRLLPDGNIEFQGRKDHQVKIRGYRIELGEIESHLKRNGLIKEALVSTSQHDGQPHLVAYVVGQSVEQGLDSASLGLEEKLAFKQANKGVLRLSGESLALPPLSDSGVSCYLSGGDNGYRSGAISAQMLGLCLSRFYRKTYADVDFPKAFYPSAGSLYPIQVYVKLTQCQGAGLAPGYYYYEPLQHTLIRVRGLEDVASDDAPLSLYLVADERAIKPLYGDLSVSLYQSEAGYMGQLLQQDADSGLCFEAVTGDDVDLHAVLGLTPGQHLLKCYQGGLAAQKRTGSVLTLTHKNRKSYRQFAPDVPGTDRLFTCLPNLVDDMAKQTPACEYYVYLRKTVGEYGKGIYQYHLASRSLSLIQAGADEVFATGRNIPIELQGSFMLLMVARESQRAEALYETGYVGQAIMHRGVNERIGFCALGSVDADVATRVLCLDDDQQVIHTMVGGAVNDALMAEGVVTEEPQLNIQQELSRYLAESLPDYMVPQHYMPLAELPLTSNGKVDKKALPSPDLESLERRYVAPRTETEAALCGIWQEVLGIEQVGVEDNFFQLGGHSLLLVKMLSKIEKKFKLKLSIGYIYELNALSELATHIDALSSKPDTEELEEMERFEI
ncbi:amino acid adenylation domain-containing protein, partial [Planctobacterium marinum]